MPYLLALTILLAPAYILRFGLFGLPANILMLWVVFVWLVFGLQIIFRRQWPDLREYIKNTDNKILILAGLFFISGLVSLFAKDFDRQKLGQFTVLFLQPISLFLITNFTIKQRPDTRTLILNTCYLLLAALGFYSIIQYFTLLGLPPAWWGNSNEPKRALGFFVHPNFYALFSAPLLAFLIPDTIASLKAKSYSLKAVFWLLGAAGLFLSLSRSGWLGLAAAIGIYLAVAASNKFRKIALAVIVFVLIAVAAVPNLRYRVILPFYGEKSAVSRLSLWETGWKGVKQSPITGLGLAGFARQWPSLNTDPGLAADSHNFPHNIFLDLWVETGLLGLASFIGISILYIYRGLRDKTAGYKFAIALFLIAMLFAGLVDNPYFKNDLAVIFWVILSLI